MTEHTFDTGLGPCTIAWSDRGLARVALTRTTKRRATARESAAPPWVEELAARLARHIAGEVQDFSDVRLDLGGVAPFHARVYEALRRIGAGRTTTYGELAARAGSPRAARAVGAAMRGNPFLLVVPCHRVLGANGKLGGFSAPGGAKTKKKLLDAERVALSSAHNLPFDANAAARELARRDKELGALIARSGPVRIKLDEAQSVFDTLARSIVYQQLAGAAARTIHGRLRALIDAGDTDGEDPANKLRALSSDALRGAGISGNKEKALRDLAERAAERSLPTMDDLHAMTDDAIVEALTRVRGVGRWTVEMLLIFRLGRPDVLPVDDYGVRKGFQRTYGGRELPSAKALLRAGEAWRPFRSIASWYLWRALE